MQIDVMSVTVGVLAGASLVAHVVAFTLIFRQKKRQMMLRSAAYKIRRDMNWGFRDMGSHLIKLREAREGGCDGRNN